MEILVEIIENILQTLYQLFWFALLLSVIFMLAWKRFTSLKDALIQWKEWFMSDLAFRKMFFLVFYTVMILFRTLLNRNMWQNPLSNVIGNWWIWKTNTSSGEQILTTECLENLALFIPFSVLLLWNYRGKIIGNSLNLRKVLWQSTKICFLFSFTIEFLQLFLRLGTWQLSDLFYNTLGGFTGGLIYWSGYKIKHKEK